MLPPLQDLYRIAPELVLCGFVMLVMFLAPIVPKARHGVLSTIALLGAALAFASTRLLAMFPGAGDSGLVRVDAFSLSPTCCDVSGGGVRVPVPSRFVQPLRSFNCLRCGLPRDSGLDQLSQT